MDMDNIKKNSTYFLVVSVILILLFIGIFSSFGLYSHCMSSTHSQNMCQMQVLVNTLDKAVMPGSVLLTFVLLVALVVLTIDRNLLKSLVNLTDRYLKQVSQFFGSFLLFNYLTLIFKQGILHPKTF